MTEPKQDTIFDTCIKITSLFEGSNYSTVSENFDGMGLSCGVLQFNLGQGTLQAYILNHINEMAYTFPLPIAPLMYSSKEHAVIWHKDNCCDINGKLKDEWRFAWEMFMVQPEVINLQKQACSKYFQRAKEICGIVGFTHQNRRAMAWAFDLAVQSWSLGIDGPEANRSQAESIIQIYGTDNYMLWNGIDMTEEQQILLIASHLRALKCKPEWRNVFFTRKATIALGIGIVNRQKHDFRKILTEN